VNAPIFARLGLTPINSRNSGLVDTDDPVHQIDVIEDEGNLRETSISAIASSRA